MSAAAVMVLGCTSGAGKSWLATALCRVYARRGFRVAPFKAQNMSNHSRVIGGSLASGGGAEIGSAQYFQALAAGASPDVRMNPVLLKPETDTRSQVITLGRVRPELSAVPWRDRTPLLWAVAQAAYDSLREDFELIVIEGAGSPAEINLAASDFVNTRTALAAGCACLLIADIDRGGAFAHLYGTHALMDDGVRRLLRGFVLNRFRGDPGLLAPGPEHLQEMTGVPTLAVVPLMRDHGLPEEDAVPHDAGPVDRACRRIVIVTGPHASNLDEFEPLRAARVSVIFARDAGALAGADLLILPGSKQTRADLAWVRASGVAEAVAAHVRAGRRLLAICGGLQMLGEWLEDPAGVEGGFAGGEAGLGLVPLITRFAPRKQLSRLRARFGTLALPWQSLSGLDVDGYEIHTGTSGPAESPTHAAIPVMRGGNSAILGWQHGSILGTYVHGLLEDPRVQSVMTGAPAGPGIQFDAMADLVEQAFRPGALDSLLTPP